MINLATQNHGNWAWTDTSEKDSFFPFLLFFQFGSTVNGIYQFIKKQALRVCDYTPFSFERCNKGITSSNQTNEFENWDDKINQLCHSANLILDTSSPSDSLWPNLNCSIFIETKKFIECMIVSNNYFTVHQLVYQSANNLLHKRSNRLHRFQIVKSSRRRAMPISSSLTNNYVNRMIVKQDWIDQY